MQPCVFKTRFKIRRFYWLQNYQELDTIMTTNELLLLSICFHDVYKNKTVYECSIMYILIHLSQLSEEVGHVLVLPEIFS